MTGGGQGRPLWYSDRWAENREKSDEAASGSLREEASREKKQQKQSLKQGHILVVAVLRVLHVLIHLLSIAIL